MSKTHKKTTSKRHKTKALPVVSGSVEPAPSVKLPNAFVVFWQSVHLLAKYWRVFGGILLVYLVLSFILVKGLSISKDLTSTKDIFDQIFTGPGGEIKSSFAVLGLLISSANATATEVASMAQTILTVMISLVIIWTLRRAYDGKKVRVKKAFYNAMSPLVPFLILLCIIGLQLLPFGLAGILYSAATSGGIIVTAWEHLLWGSVLFAGIMFGLYFISSSIFALYAVTLPNMEPRQALRSVRSIVRKRRLKVFVRLAALPLMLLVVVAVIMLPIIWLIPWMAESVFFVLTIVGLAVTHAYIYVLYRKLIG